MSWNKNAKVESLLKERIATVVLDRLNDPRLGFVTITAVELSGDKRHAKVLYTVLGTPAQRRTSGRALQDAARRIQEILAPGLHLRLMPELRFVYDESIEKQSRMLDLLDEIAQERAAREGGSLEDASIEDASSEEGSVEGAEEPPKQE